jgi:type VI secretion system protein ImpL
MKLPLIATLVAAALVPVLWFGLAAAGQSTTVRLICLAALLLAWLAFLVVWQLSLRKRGFAQRAPVTKSFVRGSTGLAEMNDHFQKCFGALKSTRPAAFSEQPWYLVIGAPGGGKSTLMEESGLAFASFGAGSPRGSGPTRSCDWWYTEEALFLDLSGRYVADSSSRDECAALIDLIAQVRPEKALNGVVVVASVPDLIKKDEAGVAAQAQQVRDRLNHLVRTLHLDLPVYVVFTKADMIGGFKDFFSGLPRAERDQPFGCTLPWQPGRALDALGAFQRETGALLPILRSRRLSALAATHTPIEQYKILQFPHQFAAVQKWMGDYLGALFRPSQDLASPVLRGFYFASAQPSPKPSAEAGRAEPPPPAPSQQAEPASLEASIFMMPNARQAAAPVGDQVKGIFIKDLLSRQVIGDRGLTQLTAAVAVRRRRWRTLSTLGSGALLALAGVWLMLWGYHGRVAIDQAVVASRHLTETIEKEPGKIQPNLAALDGLRLALVGLDQHDSAAARRARTLGQQLYYSQLIRHFLAPLGDRLRRELEELRTASVQSPATHDQLYDLYRAYQLLTDRHALQDRELLKRVCNLDHHWQTGLLAGAKDGRLDAQLELLAGNQLDYFLDHRMGSSGWEIPIDRSLMDHISAELGDILWPRQAYEDIITSLQATVATVNRDSVITGQYKELLATDYSFPVLFSQTGWDDMVAAAVTDKTEDLYRRNQSLKIEKPRERIAERLRAQYLTDYNRHWLALLASIHPVPCKDLKEAALALRALTGPQSPHRELLRTVWRNLNLRMTAAELRPLSGDDNLKWAEEALAALGEFVDAVDKFANATDTGRRSREVVRLQALQGIYESSWAKVGTALKVIEAPERRAAVSSALENLVLEAQRALAVEITHEMDLLWEERIAKPFAEQLKGRYPFDLGAKVEAPLAAFSRLFNAKDGQFVALSREIEELRKIKIAGREIMPVNRDYERMLDRAKEIREAFYANGESIIAATFVVTLVQREGVKDIRLAVGGSTFGLYDRPDRRLAMTWKEGDSEGAKLSINVVSDQWLTVDHDGSPWGLIRLLRDGAPVARSEGGIKCSWSFPNLAVGKSATFNAGALVEAPAFEKVVVPEFFVGLLCPERVGR